jgi:glycosyltransferase involved in cell wall biosynthesis
LEVPVYSIFRGKIGAVDRYLADNGRLILLESVEDVKTKVRLKRREKPLALKIRHPETMDRIVQTILQIAEGKGCVESQTQIAEMPTLPLTPLRDDAHFYEKRTTGGCVPSAAVCILVENLTVPVDRRVWQEALALRDAGYRVSIVCPKGTGFRAAYEMLESIEIYRYPIWEASGPLGYLVEYLWALTATLWLTTRAYVRTRFRILQACNPPDLLFLVGLVFKFAGVRFIFDHHDLNPELYDAKFRRRDLFYRVLCLAERLTFRTAAVSIATNDSYREIALTRGHMTPERVFVVRSVPELGMVHRVESQPELKRGRPYLVVYLGVMGPQDGLDLLLRSIACIVNERQRRDITFVLIGAGAEVSKLKLMAREFAVEDYVDFPGRLPNEAVAAYFSTADLGVAPDPATPMNDKSTMNKILEYMAFGLPVVLYDLTEGRRSAGDAALYARNGDVDDFADQILKLIDSKELRRELGERGRRRIEDRLNWALEKWSLLAAYERALEPRE